MAGNIGIFAFFSCFLHHVHGNKGGMPKHQCPKCRKLGESKGVVRTRKGSGQILRCADGHSWRLYPSKGFLERFNLKTSPTDPRPSQTFLLRKSDDELLQILSLLALGLSISEVAAFARCAPNAVNQMAMWNHQWFQERSYREAILPALAELCAVGDWMWRLRDLWRVVELDEQRRVFHNQTLALESICDLLESVAASIKSSSRKESLERASLEIIEMRTSALTSHSERDYHLRRRAYDEGLRAILKTQPQVLRQLAKGEFATTERGRYVPVTSPEPPRYLRAPA